MSEYTVEEIVAAVIASGANFVEMRRILDDKHADLPLEQARRVIDTVSQGITMDIFRGIWISDYIRKLYTQLQTPDIPNTQIQFGVLSKILNVYEGYIKRNTISELAVNSQHVGTVGEKVDLELKVIDFRELYTFDHGHFNVATFIDPAGNFFSFSPKTILTVGETYHIRGKIKSHVADKYNFNAATTRLHYAKIDSLETA